MNDHIAKPIYVDEPLLISKKNCNYSVATVKVLNSCEKILNKKTSKLFYLFRKNIPKFSFTIYYVSKLLFIMQRCYIFFMVLMCPLRLCIVCIIKQKSKEKEYETGSDR